ncbi:MAG: aspartate aminotransferase family protein [Gammaproteobacteria bacterium]|nr:aspartate aminotransferase family protein [Gammaproteobacteria bacterium]
MSDALTAASIATPAGTAPFPAAVRGEGVYLWDAAGRRYLDGSSGAVVTSLGHGNARVLRAMREQAERVCFAYARYWENRPDQELANRLAAHCGFGLDAAFFVSGGSEAIETCIKFARQLAVARGQTGRWKVISRLPSYHGNTLGALSLTGDPLLASIFAPLLAKMPKISAPLTYRLPVGHTVESWAAQAAAELGECIEREGPDSVLAFIMEPVGGTSTGALVAVDSYYRQIRETCDRYGILLILDEVMSGMGRTGRFVAAQHWPDCRPDILALGKGMGAGYTPLAAMLTSSALVAEVRRMGGFAHGHTYVANPLSCAVGCAVIDELLERELLANCRTQGDYLRAQLLELKERNPLVGDVRGRGLQLAVEIVGDQAACAPLPAAVGAMERLKNLCAERGLALLHRSTAGGQFGEWFMVCPPLIVTPSQLDELVDAFAGALAAFRDELAREGLL